MPRKRTQPVKHVVKADLRVPRLTRAGSSLSLELYAGREKLGTIVLGRGSLSWMGKSRRKEKRVSWTDFARMMNELAYGE